MEIGALFPDAARDLVEAKRLARSGHYTEAAVRVGRAMESALFATGRSAGVDVRRRRVKQIADLITSLESSQAELIKSRTTEQVRSLSKTSRRLSECIADLTANEHLREGKPDSEPRPTRALLNAIRHGLDDERLADQLKDASRLVDAIQERRNHCAHAAAEGGPREISKVQYLDMRRAFDELLKRLSYAYAGIQIRQSAAGAP
jgi:hypothetical protein